ncbi:MAG: FAD-binding protein [Actinomycetales bacterium]|nr:FAD-binding protein [Actinomycetales bacterium]
MSTEPTPAPDADTRRDADTRPGAGAETELTVRADLLEPGRRVRNWGRGEAARPTAIARPRTVDEVRATVLAARERGLEVKAIGAGHSFTPTALTDGVLVDISAIDGVLAVDAARGRVTLGAGTNLYQLPELLAPHGLALQNMGDIDRQTIAGATSTGTHGTGLAFGGLATQITALALVTAAGEVLRISERENAELLPAARVAIGALGILVELELQCVPAFLLRAVERAEPFEVVDEFRERSLAHDHFEAYWWPHTALLSTKTNTRLPAEEPYVPLGRLSGWLEDELLGNAAHALVSGLGWIAPPVTPPLNRLAAKLYGNREFTAPSYEVFTSPRRVRFREMEYAIPAEALPSAIREVRELVERKGWRISFPVELRMAAADENWLSTAHGRESAYVAVHRYWREDPSEYFTAVEAIMRAHDGRPHWGKIHTRTAADLAPAYPRFGDFLAVRDALDPDRVFANAYTRRVLGE